jgi:hypothetical protein
MAKKHTKKCSRCLAIKEMKIRMILNSTSPLLGWLSSRITTTNVGKDAEEKETLIHCWCECKLVQSLWKTIWKLFKKTKDLPYDPAIPLLRIYPKECY